MSTVVMERSTGAHVLPPPRPADERATVTGWLAHCAADADQRTKHPDYAAVAERLIAQSGVLL